MILSTLLYVELNCFAIATLLVIALNMYLRDRRYTLDQKLFLALLAVNILLLFFEMILRILDANPEGTKPLYLPIIVLYNILNPVICLIWYYYVDYYIYEDKERIPKARLSLLLPVGANAVLSVASLFWNVYFVFDENHAYSRGRFIFVLLGICFYMILYTSVFLIRNRKKVSRREFLYLLFFAVPPLAGGVIQYLFPDANLIWIATTLSVYMVFLNIQKGQMCTDYLTGVHNRRYLDSFLQAILKSRDFQQIGGVMIDIDDFKRINDLYGHIYGDQALKSTAQILKATFRKTDFIARYGGDEFLILMKINEPAELVKMVQRLQENVSLFNARETAPYQISLSIGSDCYNKDSGAPIEDFLERVDHLMYLEKQKKRAEPNGSQEKIEAVTEKQVPAPKDIPKR